MDQEGIPTINCCSVERKEETYYASTEQSTSPKQAQGSSN